MQRGLDGRRVAVYVGSMKNAAGVGVERALEQAGARVHILADEAQPGDFRGGLYAALVAVGRPTRAEGTARAVQLVREFMATDKPVAIVGDAVELLLASGGAAGRTIASDASRRAMLESAGATAVDTPIHVDDALITAQAAADEPEFASTVVREFSERLDERMVDEMSELSFPASDPPAVSPVTRPVPRREDSGEAR